MSEVFLMSSKYPIKILNVIKEQLMEQGWHCEVLNTPQKALVKVKQCFGVTYKRLPKFRKINKGPFKINPESHTVILNNRRIKFGNKEFDLLCFLVANHGKLINRNTILENVWGPTSNPFSNTVDVHISNLRKKLNTSKKTYLKTVHGAGFLFEL